MALCDLSPEILERAMKGNRAQFEKRVALEPDLEKAARGADFAIEAIVERLEPKRECLARLDRSCPPTRSWSRTARRS